MTVLLSHIPAAFNIYALAIISLPERLAVQAQKKWHMSAHPTQNNVVLH